MLRYNPNEVQISFIENPLEISLTIPFAGCNIHCPDCHSKHNWGEYNKEKDCWDISYFPELTLDLYKDILKQYKDQIESNDITCITFMGGEWDYRYLEELILYTKKKYPKLRYCLYTGLRLPDIKFSYKNLNYIKVGEYNSNLGPLTERTTNQRLYKIVNGEIVANLTNLFWEPLHSEHPWEDAFGKDNGKSEESV